MILDYGHDDINHMMDWGLNGGFFMILGVGIFIAIVVILLYVLSRRPRQHTLTDISHQEVNNNKDSDKGIEEKLNSENNYFCPNCGEKFDNRTLKYCPSCGSEM